MKAGDSRQTGEQEATGEDEALFDEFALLEEVVTVELSSRHKQEIGQSPAAITVISREDIETTGASTLPDLLRLVPGMDVIIGSPSFTSVTSRLFWTNENNHYLVLIDGREATVELLGMVPWELQPISLDDIERIEILRGPASALYGASAMAGVISITTRAVPEESAGLARVAGGEIGVMEAQARGSTRIGDLGFSLSCGTTRTHSFSEPRVPNKEVYKLRAVAEYRWSDNRRLLADLGISEGHGSMTSSVGHLDLVFRLRALRLAYESKSLRAQFNWQYIPTDLQLDAPLTYEGLSLARFVPVSLEGHMLDLDVQWTVPEFWEPLLIIVGAGGRAAWIGSDQLLDEATYADVTSNRYHRAGISHWEGRGGAFVHAEFQPADWFTATGSVRIDLNSVTDPFLSPRLATVFVPARGQHLRASVARAFRKPAFTETHLHPMVAFPEESPITGPGREDFQEFMSRAISNPDLPNEELTSYEMGYMGRFLENRLTVFMDVYFNQLRKLNEVTLHLEPGQQGLPDLEETTIRTEVTGRDQDFFGWELGVRYAPAPGTLLLASWSHKEPFRAGLGRALDIAPRNLLALGGRFLLEGGLLGSLYVFTRSEFTDHNIESPRGLLEPNEIGSMPNVTLILARLGWRFEPARGVRLEAGAKLFLPMSPLDGSAFRYFEEGGGFDPTGQHYGGDQLRRMLIFYLQGSI